MKVTYLTQPTVLHVTPQELYDLGLGVEAKLLSITGAYKAYIGHTYCWMKRPGSDRACLMNPKDRGDWWGSIYEHWSADNTLGMVLEVTF